PVQSVFSATRCGAN
uniref:Protein 2B* n=2 Tax=Cardiovirus B TaxID=1821750 RepID=ALT2B_TMEVG|nr:RecName: Full=Protein 2B* [Theiler's murine encephalomyeltits virus GDVII]